MERRVIENLKGEVVDIDNAFLNGDLEHEIYMKIVEKSVFSIWADLLLCRSVQLLVLSYVEMFVYMYLSQLMSTFINYLKVHHSLNGLFIP